jgi:hypothetical protein
MSISMTINVLKIVHQVIMQYWFPIKNFALNVKIIANYAKMEKINVKNVIQGNYTLL